MELKPCPCKKCEQRAALSIMFDVHIWGDDCPYVCYEYNEWERSRRVGEEENK